MRTRSDVPSIIIFAVLIPAISRLRPHATQSIANFTEMENTFLHFLAEKGHLQITCEEVSGHIGKWSGVESKSGAIVHRDMETMKNSGRRRTGRESNSKTFANSGAGLSALFIAMGNRSRERFRSFSRA